jgi:CheY-like chemotaxis protein
VLEDNVMDARLLRMFLTANGHAVEVAQNGLDGIDAVRRFRPEVLLCDIGLPGIDGNSIARALREESSFKNTYLIAVIGYAQDSDQERALKAGFNAYLTKPIGSTSWSDS